MCVGFSKSTILLFLIVGIVSFVQCGFDTIGKIELPNIPDDFVDFDTDGRKIYIATGLGIAVVDISDKTDPILDFESDHIEASRVKVEGEYLYILHEDQEDYSDNFGVEIHKKEGFSMDSTPLGTTSFSSNTYFSDDSPQIDSNGDYLYFGRNAYRTYGYAYSCNITNKNNPFFVERVGYWANYVGGSVENMKFVDTTTTPSPFLIITYKTGPGDGIEFRNAESISESYGSITSGNSDTMYEAMTADENYLYYTISESGVNDLVVIDLKNEFSKISQINLDVQTDDIDSMISSVLSSVDDVDDDEEENKLFLNCFKKIREMVFSSDFQELEERSSLKTDDDCVFCSSVFRLFKEETKTYLVVRTKNTEFSIVEVIKETNDNTVIIVISTVIGSFFCVCCLVSLIIIIIVLSGLILVTLGGCGSSGAIASGQVLKKKIKDKKTLKDFMREDTGDISTSSSSSGSSSSSENSSTDNNDNNIDLDDDKQEEEKHQIGTKKGQGGRKKNKKKKEHFPKPPKAAVEFAESKGYEVVYNKEKGNFSYIQRDDDGNIVIIGDIQLDFLMSHHQSEEVTNNVDDDDVVVYIDPNIAFQGSSAPPIMFFDDGSSKYVNNVGSSDLEDFVLQSVTHVEEEEEEEEEEETEEEEESETSSSNDESSD